MKPARGIAATTLALVLGSGVAAAEGADRSPLQRPRAQRVKSAELLAHVDGLPARNEWFGLRTYVEQLRIDGSTGLSYTRRLPGRHHPLELEIGGPTLDGIDTFGLSIELRF